MKLGAKMNAMTLEECARSVEESLATCTMAGAPAPVLDGLLDVLRLIAELEELEGVQQH